MGDPVDREPSGSYQVDLMRQALSAQRKLMEKIDAATDEIRTIALKTQQDLAVFQAEISGDYNLIKQRLDAIELESSKLSKNQAELRDRHIEKLKTRMATLETEQKIGKVKITAIGGAGGGVAIAAKALWEWLKS
jgi:predicted nuclease with TOPRIM domain